MFYLFGFVAICFFIAFMLALFARGVRAGATAAANVQVANYRALLVIFLVLAIGCYLTWLFLQANYT